MTGRGRRRQRSNAPTRVAHVLVRLSASAGVQVVVRRLAGGVDPDQVEMHVVTARQWIPDDELDRVPAVIHTADYPGRTYRLRDRLVVMWRVARHIRRIRPDVVQLHSGTAWMGYLARVVAPRAGFVLEVHDAPGSGRHGSLTDLVEGWWVRWLGATAVCHSSTVADAVRTRWRAPERRVCEFPLAVDTELFRPRSQAERSETRASLGVPEGVTLLLGVGRLAPSKRFDRAIDALAAARAAGQDVGLLLVGRGGELEALRAHAVRRQVAERVWFPGAMVGEELAAAFGAADILCSPSEYEGFGLTLIEGMATALPVVAVGVGGVLDVVSADETGVLVPLEEADRFPEAVAALVADSARQRELGAAGLQRVRDRYSIPSFVRSFSELYRDLAR